MLSLPEYLDFNSSPLAEEEWAFALSLNDRLSAYGFSVNLCTIKNGNSKDIPCLDTGNEIISLAGIMEADEITYLSRERFINASTWKGVETSRLFSAQGVVSPLISSALDKSIEAWLQSGAEKKPETLLERRLFGLQQNGFDIHTVFYHETDASKVNSILENGFDFSLVGARDRDPAVPDGAFMKPTPDLIDVAETPAQIPFLLRNADVKSFSDRDDVMEFMEGNQGIKTLIDDFEAMNERYDKKADKLVEALKADPRSVEIQSEFDVLLGRWRVEGSIKASDIRKAFTQSLKDQGFRRVRVEHDEGSWGRTVDSTIVLYPEDIAPADLSRAQDPVIKPKNQVSYNEREPQEQVMERQPEPTLERARLRLS